jgi:hypothetical protein
VHRFLALAAALAIVSVAANAGQARVGERTTVCTTPRLESGSPDECEGARNTWAARLTPDRRVVFRLYCMESPGETCSGMIEVPVMAGFGYNCPRGCSGHIHPHKRVLYSVAAGTSGKQVSFRLSRHQVKVLRQVIRMGVFIYAYQPDGRLTCSSEDELMVKKLKKKGKGNKAAAAALPTPDEKCPGGF